MHPLFEEADRLSGQVIAAALEVHRDKGPGLLESIYEWCLACELSDRGFHVTSQKTMDIRYKHRVREDTLRFDLLVNDCFLIEVKTVEKILPIQGSTAELSQAPQPPNRSALQFPRGKAPQ